ILQGHTGEINSVAYSPDGTTVLTGSQDNTARLWDVKTGQQLHILQGHTGYITSVAFSHQGAAIITGSNDNSARIWKKYDWNKEMKELFMKYYPLLCQNDNKAPEVV